MDGPGDPPVGVTYPEAGLLPLLEALDRSHDSICSMAKRLGLRSHNHPVHQALACVRGARGVTER